MFGRNRFEQAKALLQAAHAGNIEPIKQHIASLDQEKLEQVDRQLLVSVYLASRSFECDEIKKLITTVKGMKSEIEAADQKLPASKGFASRIFSKL